jgi:hypothetical protein
MKKIKTTPLPEQAGTSRNKPEQAGTSRNKPEQAGPDILFLIEKIIPPGTSGAVRRSVNMHRNGA